MYFCFGYCLYFYLTWLPTYLGMPGAFPPSQNERVHTVVLLSAAGSQHSGRPSHGSSDEALRTSRRPRHRRGCHAVERTGTRSRGT